MNKEQTRHKPFLSRDHCMKYLKQNHPLSIREKHRKIISLRKRARERKVDRERLRVTLCVVSGETRLVSTRQGVPAIGPILMC